MVGSVWLIVHSQVAKVGHSNNYEFGRNRAYIPVTSKSISDIRSRRVDPVVELLGRVTAINRKNLSGSERCAGGTEPDDDTGDLFRLADAADGSRGFQHLLYFRRPRHEVAIHSRLDRPGRDGVDSNVLFGVFQRDRFGQPVDGVFAGNVDRNLRQSRSVPQRKSC